MNPVTSYRPETLGAGMYAAGHELAERIRDTQPPVGSVRRVLRRRTLRRSGHQPVRPAQGPSQVTGCYPSDS